MDRIRSILPERAENIFDPLVEMVASGMPLREAIDMIISSQNGALICIGDVETILSLGDGGFMIDLPFTPQRLSELSKMDGAIVLTGDLSRIVCANFHLNPDPGIFTFETGMRHRSAARTSAQTEATVIAISKRRVQTTLYRKGEGLTLDSDQMLLSKGNQGLLALQNLRNTQERASMRLSFLEIDDIVTVADVAGVLQRYCMLLSTAVQTERYINFLGSNSGLLRSQLHELADGVVDAFILVIRDYAVYSNAENANAVACSLLECPAQALNTQKVMNLLGYTRSFIEEAHISPRGFRAFSRISMLDEAAVAKIIEEYGSLSAIVHDIRGDSYDRLESLGVKNMRGIAKSFMQLRSTL